MCEVNSQLRWDAEFTAVLRQTVVELQNLTKNWNCVKYALLWDA
ncbi:hypothetical protein M595_6337, partial [Lyngbya aestuarii BL J]